MRDRPAGYISYAGNPGAPSSGAPTQHSGMWTLREAGQLQQQLKWVGEADFIDLLNASGPAVWLDVADSSTLYDVATAGNFVTTNNAPVGRIQDKSANVFSFTQSNQFQRPTLALAAQNGRNVLNFSRASSQALTSGRNFTPNFSNDGSNYSIFAVARAADSQTNSPIIYWDNTALYSASFGMNLSFLSSGAAGAGHYAAGGAYVLAQRPYTFGTWAVFTTIRTANAISFYINNGSPATVNVSSGIWTAPTFVLGLNSHNNRYFSGSFAELIVIKNTVTDDFRISAVNHLMNKWGIV